MDGRIRRGVWSAQRTARRDRVQVVDREIVLPLDRKIVGHRNSAGYWRFSADEPPRGGCLAGDARARPLRAWNGELAGILASGGPVSPGGAGRGSDKILAVQNVALRDRRNRLLFNFAAAPGHLGGVRCVGD